MTKIIAAFGCVISGVICCTGAWKICEAGIGSWPWFLVAGVLFVFLSAGVAQLKEPLDNI